MTDNEQPPAVGRDRGLKGISGRNVVIDTPNRLRRKMAGTSSPRSAMADALRAAVDGGDEPGSTPSLWAGSARPATKPRSPRRRPQLKQRFEQLDLFEWALARSPDVAPPQKSIPISGDECREQANFTDGGCS